MKKMTAQINCKFHCGCGALKLKPYSHYCTMVCRLRGCSGSCQDPRFARGYRQVFLQTPPLSQIFPRLFPRRIPIEIIAKIFEYYPSWTGPKLLDLRRAEKQKRMNTTRHMMEKFNKIKLKWRKELPNPPVAMVIQRYQGW